MGHIGAKDNEISKKIPTFVRIFVIKIKQYG